MAADDAALSCQSVRHAVKDNAPAKTCLKEVQIPLMNTQNTLTSLLLSSKEALTKIISCVYGIDVTLAKDNTGHIRKCA